MPPPRSTTNGARPAPGVVEAPRDGGLGLPRDDGRPSRAKLGHRVDEALALPSGDERKSDAAPAGETPGEARILRWCRQWRPRQVEELVAIARGSPDGRDLAGSWRLGPLGERLFAAVRTNEDDGSVGVGGGHLARRRPDDDRGTGRCDGARRRLGRAGLVRPEAEQDGQAQRIGELRDGGAGRGDFDRRASAERKLACAQDLVDDRNRAVEAVPDQDGVVGPDDNGRDLPSLAHAS